MRSKRWFTLRLLWLAGLAFALAACGVGGPLGPSEPGYSVYYERSYGLRRMPPLHERGVDSIAVVYRPKSTVGFQYRGFFRTTLYEAYSESILPRAFIEKLLLAELRRAPFVKARLLAPEEMRLLDHLSEPAEPGLFLQASHDFDREWVFDETGKKLLAAMKAEGVDALLIFEEPESMRNFFGSSSPRDRLPPKGLWYRRNWGVHAVAAFRFVLIDTATGEPLENSSYFQASTEEVDVNPWKGQFENYSPVERKYIVKSIGERYFTNLKAMLQLLKVTPGEDGTFLNVDSKPG